VDRKAHAQHDTPHAIERHRVVVPEEPQAFT
jgi:hypothetical protein